jgi:hypothetical protein
MGEPWFRPKRFGYGAGWPIRWQWWALLAAYIASNILAIQLAFALDGDIQPVAVPAITLIVSTIVLVFIVRARTEGGWRWRD